MAEGRYLYCVGESNERVDLGRIGIEGSQVYTIPYKDLCAVVHNCPSQVYESKDKKVVESWVIAHEETIETAWKRLGTVLPLGFDTIIKADKEDPEEVVKAWLKEDYQSLKEKLNKVKGKVEYGVQISWDTKIITRQLIEKDPELKRLDQEIKSKPKGMAYMYKQKLEKLIRGKLEKEGESCFKEFYETIKHCTDEVKVEKLKKEDEPRQMLMNLSCLADKDDRTLGYELEKINDREGFSVRFTGPWPPYSFV
ncbi:MAG: gas vesicle protein GvpL [bacterium]